METRISIIEIVKKSVVQSFHLCLKIFKIIIPVFIFIQLLVYFDFLPKIASVLEPAMRFFGLPGEAAVVILLSNAINIYAGVAVLGAITLTTKQITVLALMITTSHSLFIEVAILKQLKFSRLLQIGLRVGMMIVAGLLLHWIWWQS